MQALTTVFPDSFVAVLYRVYSNLHELQSGSSHGVGVDLAFGPTSLYFCLLLVEKPV